MPPSPAYILATASAVGLGVYSLSSFKTPGVRNIERRYTAAGGAPSHTPARASKMGDEFDGEPRDGVQSKGVNSKHFQEKIADQYPESSELGKKWQRTQHDCDGGLKRS